MGPPMGPQVLEAQVLEVHGSLRPMPLGWVLEAHAPGPPMGPHARGRPMGHGALPWGPFPLSQSWGPMGPTWGPIVISYEEKIHARMRLNFFRVSRLLQSRGPWAPPMGPHNDSFLDFFVRGFAAKICFRLGPPPLPRRGP